LQDKSIYTIALFCNPSAAVPENLIYTSNFAKQVRKNLAFATFFLLGC